MTKLLIIISFLIYATPENPPVFICDNGATEVYHLDEKCRGLLRCTHEVKKLTQDKSVASELRLCGYED